ncbi:CHAT domain-containing protein [Streptomyces sp. AcE210]|uniref:CHAT domain-containing protein n=1 Tax=Streptomyces sp. AcE210 TaxID=2292703 RepID=UPI000E308236|nr:CHAT domain-containing protein [Streptomyces sp. AcE210]RFC78184.1 CHAT domain-containing protein [Streptomyces sp. AcE210]
MRSLRGGFLLGLLAVILLGGWATVLFAVGVFADWEGAREAPGWVLSRAWAGAVLIGAGVWYVVAVRDVLDAWRQVSVRVRVLIAVLYLGIAVTALCLAQGALMFRAGARDLSAMVENRLELVRTLPYPGVVLVAVGMAVSASIVALCSVHWHYSFLPVMFSVRFYWQLNRAMRAGDVDGTERALEGFLPNTLSPRHAATNRGSAAQCRARARFNRYLREGDESDLDACLHELRCATAAGDEVWAGEALQDLRLDLEDALWRRYEKERRLTSLNEVVELRRNRWSRDPSPKVICALGEALGRRYEMTGNDADRIEARDLLLDLGRRSDIEPTDKAVALLTLGTHHIWESAKGLQEALDDAIRTCREGRLFASGRLRQLANHHLSMSLLERFKSTRDEGDLQEAVALAEQTACETDQGDPLWPLYQWNLADVLFERWDLRRSDAAAASEQLNSAALRWAPVSAAEIAALTASLSPGGRPAPAQNSEPEVPERAMQAWKAAVSAANSPAATRLFAASSWGYAGVRAGNWPQASEGLGQAVELLPQAAWRGMAYHDQRRPLELLNSLAVDAAAATIAAGKPERAVELLEQGRAVMWSQTLDVRALPHSTLRESDPHLLQRLTAAAEEIDLLGQKDSFLETASQSAAELSRREERLTTLNRAWQREATQHGLLAQAPFAFLLEAAKEGPVVIINVSRIRCDIILLPPTGGLHVEPLKVTFAEVTERLDAVSQADSRIAEVHARNLKGDAHQTALAMAEIARAQAYAGMLRWLWSGIAQPALERLGVLDGEAKKDAAALERVWWCPTGLATLLPIHAAGDIDTGPTVSDYVVSSYAPTLRSLIAARRQPQAEVSDALLITPPTVLPYAAAEAQRVAQRLPRQHLRLADQDANVGTVARALPAFPYVHFIGHGAVGSREIQGGIVLDQGEMLAPSLLARLTPRHAELAYLSLCEAATPEADIADEAVHPAAVLHFNGFRHVIATLTRVPDDVAPKVADLVYEHLVDPGGRINADGAARALHGAIQQVRADARFRYSPLAWVPFVHIGP